jgi:DNA-binding XRE family transcriptional regulator
MYDSLLRGKYMKNASKKHSLETRSTLSLLANSIKVGRKARKMTQQDLAERIGISRSTLQRIEKGDPTCEIGSIFEAAAIVGIPLMGDKIDKARLSTTMTSMLSVLPKRIQSRTVTVDDNF